MVRINLESKSHRFGFLVCEYPVIYDKAITFRDDMKKMMPIEDFASGAVERAVSLICIDGHSRPHYITIFTQGTWVA